MVELRAYDHGDKYTGVAYFESFEAPDGIDRAIEAKNTLGWDQYKILEPLGWWCKRARVADPDDALDELASDLIRGRVLHVVYERFRLYQDKAAAQTNSEFLTPQGIGVTKWLVRNANLTRADKGQEPITLFHFGAEDKEPARQILRAKGIRSTAKRLKTGPGVHAVDAELHGWHYLLEILGASN